MKSWKCTALWVLALLPLGACQTGQSAPPQWVSTSASAPSESVIWEIALYALQEQKFPIGAGADPATMIATTGWRNSLAPFKGEGYRQRARLQLETIEPGKFKISLQVERETNEELARPMELQYAKWEKAPDDVDTAKIMLSKIQARLGVPLEVGEKRARSSGNPYK